MIMTDLFSRLCVVMAHPDDAELLSSGTIFAMNDLGHEISLLIATGGQHGVSIQDVQLGKVLNSDVRLKETINAFAGIQMGIHSLGCGDGELRADRNLISAIEAHFLAFAPTAVITHYCDEPSDDHQDHLAVGRACINAARRCPSIRIMLHAEPLSPGTSFHPNFFVEITDFFEKKMGAIEAHQTQAGRTYLSKEFHHVRSSYNASRAFGGYDLQGLFESYAMRKLIMSSSAACKTS